MSSPGDNSLLLWLLVWLALALIIVFLHWRRNAGVGLVLTYVVTMWMLYWLGPSAYLSSAPLLRNEGTVLTGLKESAWALGAFGLGTLVAGIMVGPRERTVSSNTIRDPSLMRIYLFAGALSYLAMTVVIGDIPTLTAIAAVGGQLFLVGLCLHIYKSLEEHHKLRSAAWIALACLTPIFTLMMDGIIGYGATAVVVVLAFVASWTGPRIKVAVIGLVAIYLGLSGLVTYMQHRNELRNVIWGGGSIPARTVQVVRTVKQAELFNPTDEDHLLVLDDRMNQSYLVGTAVERMRVTNDYAKGETIVNSLLSLVPRAIWRNKPVAAGSGSLVTKYTGIPFTPWTSIGVGQVLEFFINFGRFGVIAGFVLLGGLLTFLDAGVATALRAGNWRRFTVLFLVGLSLLQVGGSLVDIMASAGASVLFALALNRLFLYRLHRSRGPSAELAIDDHKT